MLHLPLNERLVFYLVVSIYMIAAGLITHQLSGIGRRYRRAVTLLIAAGVSMQTLLLTLRGVAVGGFPLTGLFESMLFLGIVFGCAYLLLRRLLPQVWFTFAMTWIMLFIALLGAKVAAPVSHVQEAARTPWAVAHAIAMTLGAATIAFSTAVAWMYLLANKRLKKKELGKVLGRMPNVEKLRRMNLFGIEAGFILLSFGLFTGLGMAAIQSQMTNTSLAEWFIDPKIVLVLLAWLLLAAILILRPLGRLGGKAVAYMTMITFFLVIFAIVGVTVFCGTRHAFGLAAATGS